MLTRPRGQACSGRCRSRTLPFYSFSSGGFERRRLRRVVFVRDTAEVERAIADFAGGSNGGLVVTASPFGATHPEIITALAARYRLPAVYPFRYFVSQGGLMSYGPDILGDYPRAATYVDRILRGEKPADLPVQAPTKYELVINLKTAKALGLDVPPTLLARADEVIE